MLEGNAKKKWKISVDFNKPRKQGIVDLIMFDGKPQIMEEKWESWRNTCWGNLLEHLFEKWDRPNNWRNNWNFIKG